MLDFPASPTNGQTYTAPNGSVWTWDGAKWTGGVAGAFLPLSGGTMTGDIVLAHDPPAALNPATKQYVDAQNSRYRNRVINGDMSVDQRNGGNLVAAAPSGTTMYAIDRWAYAASQTNKGTLGQSNPGSYRYLSFTSNSAYTLNASDYFFFKQTIEGVNFYDSLWGTASAQPVVLEFVAYSAQAGTLSGSIQNPASNRSYVFAYTLAANTWTKVRLNIPGDTTGTWPTTANAVVLNFNLGANPSVSTTAGAWTAGNFIAAPGSISIVSSASGFFGIYNVALMVGAAAANAEPEFRKYADNLIDCRRYYQNGLAILNMGTGAASWTNAIGQRFGVTMRAIPTMVVVGTPNYSNASNAGFGNIGTSEFGAQVMTNAAGGWAGSFNWTADADF